MHLLSQVVFEYNIHGNVCAQSLNEKEKNSSFKTIEELKGVIKNNNSFVPYVLDITRSVQVIDTDTVEYMSQAPFVITAAPTVLGCEGIRMIVSNKLTYPQDVRNILNQQYGSTLDFDVNKQWHESTPVYFSGVNERKQYGLRNSKTDAPSSYTLYFVKCRPLGSKDIVVDDNLNQIWSQKTNAAPKELIALLAKTKEEIYQR